MTTKAIPVSEGSQVAEARRIVVALAERVGFTPEEAGRAAIVATELATNLVKHGGGGTILASLVSENGSDGVEVIAVDSGPGMGDISACLRDGHSTAGSAGQGLGSVSRQAHSMDIVSWPGHGTAVLARLGRGRTPPPGHFIPHASSSLAFGAVSTPKPGEEVCGDAWAVARDREGRPLLLVADGLGHGAAAAEASTAAVRIFSSRASEVFDLTDLLERIHHGLRATRGAAVAVSALDIATGRATFAGVGNIAGAVVSPGDVRRMISHNGSAGVSARRFQAFEYPLPRDSLVVMHSDGISTSWALDRYPGLFAAHPSLIAAILWRDCCRGRDDATVLVARSPRP